MQENVLARDVARNDSLPFGPFPSAVSGARRACGCHACPRTWTKS